MPFILIKNNLKLMLRSKWIFFLMIICPIVTIGILSSAFHDMFQSTYKINGFQVGYSISKENVYKEMLPSLKAVCKNNKITLVEYPKESGKEIKSLLKREKVTVFIDIKDHSYDIYEASNKKTEAAVIESIFSNFFQKVNTAMTLASYGNSMTGMTIPVKNISKVSLEALDTDPVPSSIDYYGIIYIVYFAFCGLISLVAVITSENRGAIPKRMQVSHLSKVNYYLGKFIPCSLATFIDVCAALILSSLLYDIHWGNIGVSIVILFFVSMATAAFGIFLFQVCNNVAVSIVISFVTIWVAGFFGGSFQAYMYQNLPQKLIDLSPIYYINRTLVEFSTKGYSDFTGKCFGYLTALIIVFSIVGILFINRNKGEQ